MVSRENLRYRIDWGDGGVSIFHQVDDEALAKELFRRKLLKHPAGIIGIWQGERRITPEDINRILEEKISK